MSKMRRRRFPDRKKGSRAASRPGAGARDSSPGKGGAGPDPPRKRVPPALSPPSASAGSGGRLWRFVRVSLGSLLLFGTLGLIGAGVGGLFYYQRTARELPDVRLLRSYRPSLVTKVFDRNGELLKEFFVERRFLLTLAEIPSVVVQATLATEDARFLEHPGVDMFGIFRAALKNIIVGDIVEGGSTVTQQLAKTLFLTPKKTIGRKLREAILAVRIERSFDKSEILNMYLNQIYYGHGSYGIEAAARVYFGKKAVNLTLSEAALLAGLPRAPSIYSPSKSLRLARRRRAHVLRRMQEEGYISSQERTAANNAAIQLVRPSPDDGYADYANEEVRRALERRFGATTLYRGGLRVQTTIDRRIQRTVNAAVRKGIIAVDHRRGYRGPVGRVPLQSTEEVLWRRVDLLTEAHRNWREVRGGRWELAVVHSVRWDEARLWLRKGPAVMWREDVAWARPLNLKKSNKGVELENLGDILQAGDVVLVERRGDAKKPNGARPVRVTLAQEPLVQAAAIVIDQRTGAIRAMVGGYDFDRSKFNRAVQAVRPPGSAFKPVTFSAAISEGWTPSDPIIDAPVIFPNLETGGEWKPTNFGKKFYGPTTLREALARSRNVVAVKLAHAVGVDKVVARARQLRIRSPLEENLSLALGSSGVTLLEMTSLYGVLAERGRHVEPLMIRHVEGPDGKLLWAASPRVRQAIPPEEAYVSLDLLKNVVESGTAVRAKALKRPLAGKTGTTNDFQDAWFVGVSPFYSVGIWVGMDDKSTLGQGETGARAALPIWMDITRAVHESFPPKDFGRPPNVTMVYIDPKTGARLPRNVAGGVFQAFVAGTGPPFFPHEPREIDGIRDLFREDVSLETGPISEDTPPDPLSSSP